MNKLLLLLYISFFASDIHASLENNIKALKSSESKPRKAKRPLDDYTEKEEGKALAPLSSEQEKESLEKIDIKKEKENSEDKKKRPLIVVKKRMRIEYNSLQEHGAIASIASNASLHEQTKEKQEKKIEAEPKKFIYDSYTSRRGTPKMLAIHCTKCKAYVMHYQKDGPGRLLRCYLDRIHAPEKLQKRQFECFSVKDSRRLRCLSCEAIIGVPMIYKMEQRPAYHLDQNTFYFR